MAKIDIYNQAGQKVESKDLNKQIFAAKLNEGLVHQAMVRQMANARYNLGAVKTRAQVKGGGRKPFRQKGTGRARQGTIRAPHMKGGGVVFGPSGVRNFSLQMPKKQRRAALFAAISSKLKDKAIFGLKEYKGEVKTKIFAEMISNLPVERNVLFILENKNPVFEKSARNLPNVKTILAANLNVIDLLKYKKLCLVADADKKIEELFLK